MNAPPIYDTDFSKLDANETVGEALQRMLADRVSDMPVVDGAGKLIGMFKLEELYASLLPKAALLGHGMADLSFASETLEELREKMDKIDDRPVHEFVVVPRHVVHEDTTPLEIVLLLHQGENNVPVADRASGRLIGMVSARDLLTALMPGDKR
jgi:CBS domain-containing protein